MKATRHRDGSYSLVNLNRADVEVIAAALSAAAAWQLGHGNDVPNRDARQDVWNSLRSARYDRLRRALDMLVDTGGSVTVRSPDWGACVPDDYTITDRR